MGISVRVTLSARTLEKGQVELKYRTEGEHSLVGMQELVEVLRKFYC